MLKPIAPQRGFTIIEVLISLVVLGILAALGAPTYFEWIQNQRIRAATDAILNGIQIARATAIERNLPVQIVISPDSSWAVSEVASGTAVQARTGAEGSQNAVVTTTPLSSTTITFAQLGGVTTNADATPSITQIDVGNQIFSTSAARQLRILVSGGGSVRMCDPTPTIDTTDPRHC